MYLKEYLMGVEMNVRRIKKKIIALGLQTRYLPKMATNFSPVTS